MTKKQKKMLMRILCAAALYVVLVVLEKTVLSSVFEQPMLAAVCYLIPYLIVGWDIVKKAVVNIFHGQVCDENFLMCIASVGAFAVGEFEEAVAVILFYQVGELFQSYAVGKSRKSVSDLMDICPEYAHVYREGEVVTTDPAQVHTKEHILIKAGERVPLDGVVIEGTSFLDTSALTGESVPREVKEGDAIISGCINGKGVLKVEVTKPFADSTVSRILELVENASTRKAAAENFITRFARYYTPIVVIAAVLLAALPPLLFSQPFVLWMRRACIFLVVSCPCALVISVPLSFFGGIGAASRHGILVKGSNYLESLAKMDIVVFDKTGTLTKGEFAVQEIIPSQKGENTEEQEAYLLKMAAAAEQISEHPIALSLLAACKEDIKSLYPKTAEEIAGQGIKAVIDGKNVLAGNEKLMRENGSAFTPHDETGTIVYTAEEGEYLGAIIIADQIKEGTKEAIFALKEVGTRKTVLLTGDKKQTGEAVAKTLGMDEVYTELLPEDKVSHVEQLLEEKKKGLFVAFVGDGINDAPVLTRADIGIAMGAMGSDAAIEAADVVLMKDSLSDLSYAVTIAKKTVGIARQNIIFALAVKLLVLLLGAAGIATMWEAVFADVGVSVIAILNAMRLLLLDKS